MAQPKDYYNEGRRDAENDDGYTPPHNSFLDRIFWDDDAKQDREDYKDGYRDGDRK